MLQFSVVDSPAALSPVEQGLEVVVHILGLRVLLPLEREVHAKSAVSLAAVLGDCKYLVRIEHLWYAPEGGQQSEGVLDTACILAEAVCNSLLVVIARKYI